MEDFKSEEELLLLLLELSVGSFSCRDIAFLHNLLPVLGRQLTPEKLSLLYLFSFSARGRIYSTGLGLWVHNINKQRLLLGEFHTLVKELASYEDKFFEYFRMSQHQFHYILNLLEDVSRKN